MRHRQLWTPLLVLAGLIVMTTAQAAEPASPAPPPTAKVQAISYPPNKAIDLVLQGTAKSPKASGRATVSTKGGTTDIEVALKDMETPSSFGPEYLVYVLWAVTPEGQVSNLGSISLDGRKGELHATSRFQTFALGVTAEPYFAVTAPSDTVVLANAVPDKKDIQTEPIEAKAELLQRGSYKEAGLKPVTIDPKLPIELYQARHAVQIARWKQADKYAADTFGRAVAALEKAEAAQVDKKAKPETVIMASRDAVQSAENARKVAVTRAEEERQAAERKASEDREMAARAQADAETQARQVAEQQRAQSETARLAAQVSQQQALGQAAQARAQASGAQASAQRLRMDLLGKLNKILATKDTERGLVATMADVTFSTGSADLKPAARESLAKLSGVIASYPGLKLDIEGYTDNVGSDATNQALSEKRAQAVRDYLAGQGMPEMAISAKGLGKAMPVAPNETPDGRAKNRRVEVIVSGEAIGMKVGG